jgi:TRAP-type C4-dicarboxylate transport system permease large subunit
VIEAVVAPLMGCGLLVGVLMVIAVIIGEVTPPMAIALVISGRLAEVDQLRVCSGPTYRSSGACSRSRY